MDITGFKPIPDFLREKDKVTIRPMGKKESEEIEKANSIVSFLQGAFKIRPEHIALIFLDNNGNEIPLTIRDLVLNPIQIALNLKAKGLEIGDSAIIIMKTGADLVRTYFGCIFAGVIPALLASPTHRIAVPEKYIEHMQGILRGPNVKIVITDLSNLKYKDLLVKQLLPNARVEFIERLAEEKPKEATLPDIKPDDIASIQYSSGSTGLQKAILLSHKAIMNNIRNMKEHFQITANDVSVNWIPLYHDMGLIGAFLLPLVSFSKAILMDPMNFLRHPVGWLWAIHHYAGTISWSPNSALSYLVERLDDDEIQGVDLSTLRLLVNGSEPVFAETIQSFVKRFQSYGLRKNVINPAYGMSENVCAITAHKPFKYFLVDYVSRSEMVYNKRAVPCSDLEEKDGLRYVSVGQPIVNTFLRIVGENGNILPERSVGEIVIKSDSLMNIYLDDPENTALALRDGWLFTGDNGYMANGYLYFVSRKKDLIIIGGENYFPQDIERLVEEIEGVRKGCSVAIGVSNIERGTEEVAVIAETRERCEDELRKIGKSIRGHVVDTLGVGIRKVLLVPPNSIEKTTSGKLARSATKEKYLNNKIEEKWEI